VPTAEPDRPQRLRLTLHKHAIGWHPKPTIVFAGRGYPAQWGTGTWQVPDARPTTIKVYLFNRLWTYGRAEFTIDGAAPGALVYRAPMLPFGKGALMEVAA
jgi:hypothetical protein